MTKSHVGAYWGPREDGVEHSAAMVVELVRRLADYDAVLTGWRKKGTTKAKALAEPVVTFDEQQMVERLLAGRNRTDLGGDIIADLGYRLSWWNGRTDKKTAAHLSVHIDCVTPQLPNSVVLYLPDSSFAPDLYQPDFALRILTTIVDIFGPDRAVWTDDQLVEPQQEPDQPLEGGGYRLGGLVGMPAGWATFIRDGTEPRFDEAALPPCTTQRIGGGTLVVVGDDPADAPLDSVLAVRRAMGYTVRGALPEQQSTAGAPVTAASFSTHAIDLQKPTGAPHRDAPPANPVGARPIPATEVADTNRDPG